MRFLLYLSVLLAGCASGPYMERLSDGRTALTPETADITALMWEGRVKYIETDDVARVCGALNPASRLGEYLNAAGCYRVWDGICYVVSRRVKSESDFKTPGHEFAGHCVRGTFHKKLPDGRVVWIDEVMSQNH